MSTLDRYIVKGLVVNYLIALGVMISLYVVLDMFFNMDEFTENHLPTIEVIQNLGSFYGARVFLYFAQLSGIIALFACMLTLARMRRDNELTAIVASGVSLHRVAAPVLGFALAATGLWYVDTEIVIPSIAPKLARRHDDPRGVKTYQVSFLKDRENALLLAMQYVPSEGVLKQLLVIKRNPEGRMRRLVQADRATWEPTPSGPTRGRWVLERGIERWQENEAADSVGPGQGMQAMPIRYYDSDLDPPTIEMRQSESWVDYLSSARLAELSDSADPATRRQIARARNTRFTSPLTSLVMLCLGLPLILNRMPGNILASGGRCLLLCGACYLLAFAAQHLNLGASGGLSALPSWLPIIVFTPAAAVLLDRMQT